MTDLTAQQLADTQNAQVEEIADALQAAVDLIEAMKSSTIEGFQIWNGGLPDVLSQLGMQTSGQLINLRQRFPTASSPV